MSTFLFDQIIFGPVQSRRLGVSLGINLLPTDSKVCSFNCIYCECGWTPRQRATKAILPSRETVAVKLKEQLQKMQADKQLPDVITFAGNGEPTLHPKFPEIISDTLAARDQYAPKCKVAVLSNAMRITQKSIFDALLRVDDNILKLDSAIPETIQKIDCPMGHYHLDKTIETLCQFGRQAIIQTLFLRGSYQQQLIDNTTDEEIQAWLNVLQKVNPGQVMIYSLDRDTPASQLEAVSHEELEQIASRVRELGLSVQVS